MPRKKIDNRIRTLIENGVETGHRTMFLVVGEKAKDQVVYLHHMLSKTVVKARPTVLWCYKKELGFTSHRKKKMKSLQKKVKAGKLDVNEDDPFELFIVSTKIRYCYYKETHKILGNTFGMCVLQDFEALTPNLLARTMETVEGGGIITILLQSVNSLKQLYEMNMDVHKRFRTEVHQDVTCRFNERFLLSLASCARCLVIDDQFHVLPISMHNLKIQPAVKMSTSDNNSSELQTLKENLRDTQPVSTLLECCKTLDQGKALLKFIEAISEKTLRSTVSLTAARGRGKSATMGLAIAGAIAFGYSNIYVSSPSPENLNTLFEFVFKGLEALEYKEHLDYTLMQSTNPEFNKATIRVNVFRNHRQTIQFIHPADAHKLQQAELLVIDEAAAIPLPFVKAMFGPYLIFLASTINGYEGTGRSLSLKLLQQLRVQSKDSNSQEKSKADKVINERTLEELTLDESIRYKPGDDVETWLSTLLCLDAGSLLPPLLGCPPPDTCQLLYINRDTLFSFHKASEKFLQKLVSLYVASHYKNTPNDLQMMSDAPAHHLFCLVGPLVENKLPEVLVFIQICMEGKLSKNSIEIKLGRGQKAAGDLIPWTISQQFNDQNFPILSGARIVRIATHPEYQGMGYGAKALDLLKEYYSQANEDIDMENPEEVKTPSKSQKIEGSKRKREEDNEDEEDTDLLTEIIQPRASLPPLFLKLSERPAESLDYIGVSFGVTEQLLKFWKKAKFVPVYLRQTANDITGENTCIMIHKLNYENNPTDESWLQSYSMKFRQRFTNLLASAFRDYKSSFALSLLENNSIEVKAKTLTRDALEIYLDLHDLEQLDIYSKNMSDYHLIRDQIPSLAKMYFLRQLGNINLAPGQKNSSLHISAVQAAILLGLGLQHKSIEQLEKELDLQSSQLLGLFNKIIKKFTSYLNSITEEFVRNSMD